MSLIYTWSFIGVYCFISSITIELLAHAQNNKFNLMFTRLLRWLQIAEHRNNMKGMQFSALSLSIMKQIGAALEGCIIWHCINTYTYKTNKRRYEKKAPTGTFDKFFACTVNCSPIMTSHHLHIGYCNHRRVLLGIGNSAAHFVPELPSQTVWTGFRRHSTKRTEFIREGNRESRRNLRTQLPLAIRKPNIRSITGWNPHR